MVLDQSTILTSVENAESKPLIKKKKVIGRISKEKVRTVGSTLARRLGITPHSLTQWYIITPEQILRHGGLGLPWRYLVSIKLLAKTTYPDHIWEEEKFHVPRAHPSFLKDPTNVRAAMLYLGEQLGISETALDKWYRVTRKSLEAAGGRLLFEHFSDLRELLQVAFPEHQWNPEKFERKVSKHWRSSENKKRAFQIVSEKLGIQMDDYYAWYKIRHKDLVKGGMSAFLNQSRYEFFSKVFPEHNWSPYLFPSARRFDIFSASDDDLVKFAKDLEQLLNITEPLAWYHVPKGQLYALGFARVFHTQAYLLCLLQVVYPDIDWDPHRFAFSALGYGQMFSNVVKLFGRETIKGNVYKTDSPLMSSHHEEFQKTLLVPKFKLVFDYHGPSHYARQLLEGRNIITKEERLALSQWCHDSGFTLVSIPFWMERDKKYILAELWSVRPDLFGESNPLHAFAGIASTTLRMSESIPRKNLDLHPTHLRLWRRDPRYEEIALVEASKSRKDMKKERSGRPHNEVLLEVFETETKPGRIQREQLAAQLGWSLRRVDDWFRKMRRRLQEEKSMNHLRSQLTQ